VIARLAKIARSELLRGVLFGSAATLFAVGYLTDSEAFSLAGFAVLLCALLLDEVGT
jgi:hypothetical protein